MHLNEHAQAADFISVRGWPKGKGRAAIQQANTSDRPLFKATKTHLT